MWSDDKMFADNNGVDKIQIFSDKFGFPTIPLPENCSITISNIGIKNVDFSNSNYDNDDGYNPVDENLKMTGAYVVELNHDLVLKGQIISIPNTLFLRGYGIQTSILSTHLLVSPDNRNRRFAESLILSTVKEAFDRKYLIGYHWIKQSKTKSSIESYCWYRPLHIGECLKAEYELKKGVSYNLPLDNKDIITSITVSSDFKNLKSATQIRLHLSDEELDKISKVITFITFKRNNEIVGIVGYRKFDIIKRNLKLTVKAALISYFDCSKNWSIDILTKMMRILTKEKFSSVHGVLMSNLADAYEELKLTLTDQMYLDFCNVGQPGFKMRDIAVLYI